MTDCGLTLPKELTEATAGSFPEVEQVGAQTVSQTRAEITEATPEVQETQAEENVSHVMKIKYKEDSNIKKVLERYDTMTSSIKVFGVIANKAIKLRF